MIIINPFQNNIAKYIPTRAFATANDKYANLAEINQNHGTSIPPVAPPNSGDKLNHTTHTSQTLAREFKKVSGKGITGTYTAFGATEELYKTCGAQANYSIPQALDPDAEMPKTEEGEDLGVGKGWWHDRECFRPPSPYFAGMMSVHKLMCPRSSIKTYLQYLVSSNNASFILAISTSSMSA